MKKECNKPETGCDYECLDCEVPTTEPEYCESCETLATENGYDYEFNVDHISGYWKCSHCNKGV